VEGDKWWTSLKRTRVRQYCRPVLYKLDAKNGGHTEVNRDRRKMLLEGHDYTASIVTQILSLHQKVDDEMLVRLDDARRTRNNFAHSLRDVTWEDAACAIGTANELISKVVGTRAIVKRACSGTAEANAFLVSGAQSERL
jgi:hypothetical protein